MAGTMKNAGWKDRFKSLFVPGHLRGLLLKTDEIAYRLGRDAGYKGGHHDGFIERRTIGEMKAYDHLQKTRDPYNEIAAKFVVAEQLYDFRWQDPVMNQRLGNNGYEPVQVNGNVVMFDGQILARKLRQPAYPRILEAIPKILEGIQMMYCGGCLLGFHDECEFSVSINPDRGLTCECFKGGHPK